MYNSTNNNDNNVNNNYNNAISCIHLHETPLFNVLYFKKFKAKVSTACFKTLITKEKILN